MEFARPWFLLLLLVLPALALALPRSLTEPHRVQRFTCLGIRALILALLALALAGPRISSASKQLGVVFLIDASASITKEAQQSARAFITDALAQKPASTRGSIVGFAEGATLWSQTLPSTVNADFPLLKARNATDVGGALAFASAILPSDSVGRIVLLSDGNDTGGQALAAAAKLRASGIQIDTVPLQNPDRPEVRVAALDAPRSAKSGEPFDLTATIQSSLATHASVRLYQNRFLLQTVEQDLRPGRSAVSFRNLSAPEGSSAAFEVEVVPARDTVLENNRAQAVVSISGQPRVLILDPEPARLHALQQALSAAQIQAEIQKPIALPRTLTDLQPYDLLILSDVSALLISPEQMRLYQSWVRDYGGSFAMLGGENSFGVGGYYKTPVEEMLPVRMDHDDREETPSVALLVALDRSGSMSAIASGQTKISLADQGAVYSLDVMQPRDSFGVTAIDTRVHSVVPLGPLRDKAASAAQIMSITAGGGGIYIYTTLVDAFQQLRATSAKIKHVILFSDATDAEEKSAGEQADGTPGTGNALDLASAMLASQITVSVVGLGNETDQDTKFLRELAERGGGRFYLTSDATTLPQIFSTETMKVSQSSLNEEPFLAVPAATGSRASMIAGLDWPQSPLLLGCNTTKPKPGADLLLATERGEPLLAVWRYGLGQAAAFTSDAKPRWASEWINWPGFGKFWAQFVRGFIRSRSASAFQITTTETGDQITLGIDAVTPAGEFRDQLPLTVYRLDASGKSESKTATQTAPGHYTVQFPLPTQGTSTFSIASAELPGSDYRFSHTRSFPAEFLTSAPNETLLQQLATLTGGRFAPKPAEVFAPPDQPMIRHRDLSPILLMLALVLFPFDIWLRRRTWA